MKFIIHSLDSTSTIKMTEWDAAKSSSWDFVYFTWVYFWWCFWTFYWLLAMVTIFVYARRIILAVKNLINYYLLFWWFKSSCFFFLCFVWKCFESEDYTEVFIIIWSLWFFFVSFYGKCRFLKQWSSDGSKKKKIKAK